MLGLVAYGSLMDPQEFGKVLLGAEGHEPVRVSGFRRSFGQEPAWRVGKGRERGVLTVRPSSPADWFNGVLLIGLEAGVFELLDHRERGYLRQRVTPTVVSAYGSRETVRGLREIHLYVGRQAMRNDELLPNPVYLQLCWRAARRWGLGFARDFLATTRVGGEPLSSTAVGESLLQAEVSAGR